MIFMPEVFGSKKFKVIFLILVFLCSLVFPLTKNVTLASGNIVSADIDGDGRLEQTQDNDGNSVNGYETFSDPDGSSKVIRSGNYNWDGHTDYFLDTNNDGQPEKYWDPSDNIISNVTITKVEDTAKTTANDWVFSSQGNNINDRYYSPNFNVIRKMARATDLSITKTVSNVQPSPGAIITYTFTINNSGSYAVSGVQATNVKAPAQFIYQSSTLTQGTYDPATGAWTIGSLAANAYAILTLTVQIPMSFCDNITDPTATVSYTPSSTAIALPKGGSAGTEADATYLGSEAGQQMGEWPIDNLGDINGDGYPDLAVGGSAHIMVNVGHEYIMFGKPTGWQKNQNIANAADMNFYDSVKTHLFLGWWNPDPIDLNGDGIKDLVFSDYWAGGNRSNTFILFGKKTGWPTTVNLASSSSFYDASFYGVGTAMSNYEMTRAGDINHDGFDDMMMGGGNTKNYFIFGKSSGWAKDSNLASSSDASMLKEISDYHGTTAISIGDVNHDGIDDFLIPDYATGINSDTGKVWLFFGKTSGWGLNQAMATSSNASFLGEGVDNELDAETLQTQNIKLGDINGDGVDDFSLYATHNSQTAYHAGKVYIFFGRTSPGWQNNMGVATASDASFLGEGNTVNARDHLAQASNIGDINGDGISDIGFSAYNKSDHQSYDGKVYAVLGKTSGWQKDVNIDTASAFSVYGDNANQEVDETMGVGDYNKDGYDDFVVESWSDNTTQGSIFLFLGRTSGWPKDVAVGSSADASYYGESSTDGLRLSGLGSIGDINGDGYPDFAMGAGYNDQNGVDAGKVYIVFGRESVSWLIDSNYANNSATAPVQVQCSHPIFSGGGGSAKVNVPIKQATTTIINPIVPTSSQANISNPTPTVPAVNNSGNAGSGSTNNSAPTANSAPTKYVFSRNSATGSLGTDVKQLQQYLNTHGFILAQSGPGSPGKETAKFGRLTRLALIRFQQANHVAPAIGYFGPITRKAINGK
jgi:uncharacterized repeat protein (TIGR01451 family)